MQLPVSIPSKAVLVTLDHVLAHGHEVSPGIPMKARDHFLSVLLEEIGLQERGPAQPKTLLTGPQK